MEIMNQLHFKKPMKQQMVKRGKLLNHTVAIVIPKIELKLKKFEFNPQNVFEQIHIAIVTTNVLKRKKRLCIKRKRVSLTFIYKTDEQSMRNWLVIISKLDVPLRMAICAICLCIE